MFAKLKTKKVGGAGGSTPSRRDQQEDDKRTSAQGGRGQGVKIGRSAQGNSQKGQAHGEMARFHTKC